MEVLVKSVGEGPNGIGLLLTMIKTYADENLLRINVFIRDPFVTKFVRDEAQSVINFVSTCGGLMGLCMGFSFISGVEILFYCLLVKVYQIWEPRNTKQKRHEKEKKKIK